jgi:hypothetical protein
MSTTPRPERASEDPPRVAIEGAGPVRLAGQERLRQEALERERLAELTVRERIRAYREGRLTPHQCACVAGELEIARFTTVVGEPVELLRRRADLPTINGVPLHIARTLVDIVEADE